MSLGALMLTIVATDAWLDEHALWEAIGRRRRTPAPMGDGPLIGCDSCGRVGRGRPGAPCRRCNAPLRVRKPDSIARSWALLIAAAVFYIPANLYPILTLIRFGRGQPSTILGRRAGADRVPHVAARPAGVRGQRAGAGAEAAEPVRPADLDPAPCGGAA